MRQKPQLPENMHEISSEEDRRMIAMALAHLNNLAKRTTKLVNRLEILDSYYKVHCEGFNERVECEKLVEFRATANVQSQWPVIRKIYCEMDTNRIVV